MMDDKYPRQRRYVGSRVPSTAVYGSSIVQTPPTVTATDRRKMPRRPRPTDAIDYSCLVIHADGSDFVSKPHDARIPYDYRKPRDSKPRKPSAPRPGSKRAAEQAAKAQRLTRLQGHKIFAPVSYKPVEKIHLPSLSALEVDA